MAFKNSPTKTLAHIQLPTPKPPKKTSEFHQTTPPKLVGISALAQKSHTQHHFRISTFHIQLINNTKKIPLTHPHHCVYDARRLPPVLTRTDTNTTSTSERHFTVSRLFPTQFTSGRQ
jgi:hypothetical protein